MSLDGIETALIAGIAAFQRSIYRLCEAVISWKFKYVKERIELCKKEECVLEVQITGMKSRPRRKQER